MKAILVALALVLAFQMVAFGQAAVDPKYLVVPGKSVGELSMGMTIDQVKAILGNEGNEVQSGPLGGVPGVTYYYFGSPREFEVFVKEGKVISINTFLASYRTAESIGVGSSFAELLAAYGSPKVQQSFTKKFDRGTFNVLYVEFSNGLTAHIDRSTQKLFAIGI